MPGSPRHVAWPAALLFAAVVVPVLPRLAAAEDLFVLPAAVDQPRICIAFAPASDPTNPFTGEGIGGGEDIQIRAFWDTGASGIVLAPLYAEAIEMSLYQFGGQDVIFSDVGAGGTVPFNVSEQVVMRIAPSLGLYDGEPPYDVYGDPASFMTLYDAVGPTPSRLQIGPIGSEGDLNVVGMPTMVGRKNVFDPRPTDNIIKLFDEDPNNDLEGLDSFYRSYSYPRVYELGTIPPGSSDPLVNPGIPSADVSVSLSYADFSAYTDVTPTGAEAPTHTHNPFLGPNPLNPQSGDPPAPILRRGALSMEGSWLLDTGAAASFISQVKAAELNVEYSEDPLHDLGSDDPELVDSITGQPIPNQFQIPIQGIGGSTLILAGFYADSLTIPTDQGNPNDPNDPNHLHFVAGEDSLGAPVLVLDIVLQNPDDPLDIVVLDGIFGMNFMACSAAGDFVGDPIPTALAFSPFDGIVFDEFAGKLYFSFNDGLGWPVPEPGAALLGLGLAGLLMARRRAC